MPARKKPARHTLPLAKVRARHTRFTKARCEADMGEMGGCNNAQHKPCRYSEGSALVAELSDPSRANLIQKGMIYRSAHGDMAFTMPLFDEFMLWTIPDLP